MTGDYRKNAALLQAAAEGDSEAEAELLRCNTPLVHSIARRFCGRGTDFEDLTQIGMMGLLKAVRSFDPARGCALSTYAVPLISGEIRRFLRDDGPIKVSRAQKKLSADLLSERERLQKAGTEKIPLSLLAERCGVSPEEAAAALDASSPPLSLSEPINGEEDLALENTLYDEEEETRTLDRLALSMAMAKLPPLERKILLLRYYRDLSQEKTAHALGLTQVKVSRAEKKILAFLRRELAM